MTPPTPPAARDLDASPGSPRSRAAGRLSAVTGAAEGSASTLDRLADLTARLLGAPAAQISLLADVQVIAGSAGLPPGTTGSESPVADSLCTVTAAGSQPLVVADAVHDGRVAHLPPVARGSVGAYLGAPLTDGSGLTVGALCVFGPEAREWSPADVTTLEQLAQAAMAEMELSALSGEFELNRVVLDLALGAAQIGVFDLETTTGRLTWDARLLEMFGYSPTEFDRTLDSFTRRLHPEDRDRVGAAIDGAVATGGLFEAEYRIVLPDDRVRWVLARGRAVVDEDGVARRLLGAAHDVTQVREEAARSTQVLESTSTPFCSLDRTWRFTYVNARAEAVLGRSREELLGGLFWDLFPAALGTDFETHYRSAMRTRTAITFEAYYPPPLDAWYELHADGSDLGLSVYFLDITARRAAERARDLAARRLEGLGRAALALALARSVEDLAEIVADQGLAALGCDGGAVAVPDPVEAGVLDSYITSSFGADTRAEYARMSVATPLPVCEAARTGVAVLLPDAAASLAYSPLMAEVNRGTGCQAWASLPLRVGGEVLGVLTAGWSGPQDFSAEQVALLEAFAAQCAQALQRLAALEAERAAAAAVREMSERLQRSLLAELPSSDHLELAARYLPAATGAEIGGDWYDAFTVRDGSTSLVIGDVTGHDREAAVAMAGVRNVLRGVAHALASAPAATLTALDLALEDLSTGGSGALATAVLARVEQGPEDAAQGVRRLRWSNAGHPPPLLVHPDGRAELLERATDLLLGLSTLTDRHDHTAVLAPGSTVVLYTDGLVERRGEHLQVGLERLVAAAERLGRVARPADAAAWCDALLAELAVDADDDIAVLAVRTRD